METLLQYLKYGVRILRRSPGYCGRCPTPIPGG